MMALGRLIWPTLPARQDRIPTSFTSCDDQSLLSIWSSLGHLGECFPLGKSPIEPHVNICSPLRVTNPNGLLLILTGHRLAGLEAEHGEGDHARIAGFTLQEKLSSVDAIGQPKSFTRRHPWHSLGVCCAPHSSTIGLAKKMSRVLPLQQLSEGPL